MNETDEIKSRLPIEEVVGGYLPLKKAGRIFKANCPFHGEKTPSFTVSPDRGIFKCFGCGEGGDIFDFVMKIEGLTFPETIRLLADRAGVQLPERENAPKRPEGPGKEQLLKLNAYAARLWNTILTQHPKAEPARAYLSRRGLSPEIIESFQIGYAPAGNVSAEALRKAGFSAEETAAGGEPGRFRNRITFPICDLTGKVMGFTGRILEELEPANAQPSPKYWNTPETQLFLKSRTVYALHLAKRSIQEEDAVIMAEGQMDVVALHQGGYRNTVASSGTALTTEQVKLLGRFTQNIVFAYDRDNAGIEATKRGIELVLAAGLNPSVITVPVGKDPADCLQQDPAAWEQAYAERAPFMRWLLNEAGGSGKALNPEDKKRLAGELLPWLVRITDPIERQDWLRQLSGLLLTEESSLRQALAQLKSKAPPTHAAQEAPAAQVEAPSQPLLTEMAAALLIAFPDLLPQVRGQLATLRAGRETPFLLRVLELIEGTSADGTLREKISVLTPDEQKTLSLQVQEALRSYDEQELDENLALEELFLLLRRIRSQAKEQGKARLAQEIRQAQAAGDTAELMRLFGELQKMTAITAEPTQ